MAPAVGMNGARTRTGAPDFPLARAYGDAATEERFAGDASAVREALIDAVHEVHPGVRFEVPEKQYGARGKFLMRFDKLFTLNYDLLQYWVILAATKGFQDGFGLGDEVNGFRTFRTGALCNTYYLHGALHLFLDQELEALKRVVTGSTIVDDIANTIRARSQLPLIVAEGTAVQKIARIRSVPYLHHCYDELIGLGGTLSFLDTGFQPMTLTSMTQSAKAVLIRCSFAFTSQLSGLVRCVRNSLDTLSGQRTSIGFTWTPPALMFGAAQARNRNALRQ